ncbi:FAD:protein FMN transferase [Neobacillus drentensis]|uniref:FAD:protein FMN transferase n=1 Tax=Neobacillus drentensis TaxID=220684 RepID=UPI002FFDE476
MIDKQEGLKPSESLTFTAMNTTFFIEVTNCSMPNWKEVIHGWIQYVEKEWSRFQGKNNELGQLNQLAIGEKMILSPPLFDILHRAEDYRQKTSSTFSPYLLPQLQYHGYESTFPFTMSRWVGNEMPPLFENVNSPFLFEPHSNTVMRTTAGKVDLGGIGKGYAVQAVARWLKNIGGASTGMVDGGGDMTVWSDGNKEWKIGVAHPHHKEVEITQFRIKNGSIATSNSIFRSWTQGNVRKHHILNGRTGLPAENTIIQATVITENCLDAEVGAKICLIEDVSNIKHQLKRLNPASSFLLINNQGEVLADGWEE